MKIWLAALAVLVPLSAHAESCTRSRDTIFDSGDLPQKPDTYRALHKMCLETLEFSNVKDAYILKAGIIAIVPKNASLSATAITLSQFCTRFPQGHAHFVGRKGRAAGARADAAAAKSTPCSKIGGTG